MSRFVLVLAIAVLAATAAKADGIDPTVVIRHVDPTPLPITSPTETFNLFATATHNIFAFQNDTGETLTSLVLDLFAGTSGLTYSCGSFAGADIFSSCTSASGSGGATVITFSGVGDGFTGITAATCTAVDKGKGDDDDDHPWDWDLHNHDDKTTCTGGIYSLEFDGIPAGAVVRGTGTVSAPEPLTATLLVSGLLGLAGLRKRRAA